MRAIRKAVLEDIGALFDCDIEFGFGSRNEFVERAIRRGGAYILEQEGNVIGVAVLEYTFFDHGFYFFSLCHPCRAQNRSRRDVVAISGVYLPNPEAFFLHEPKQLSDASPIRQGWFSRSGMIHNGI
jgi:hypothetical protein